MVKCEFSKTVMNSIILSVTCHGLENFSSLVYTDPSYPFGNFPNPMSLLFLEFESFVNG